jgi:hypothetical protein
MARLIRTTLLFVFLLVATACTSAPLMNVTDAPISRGYTAEQVKTAILKAGAGRGWVMQSVKPGLVRGTLDLRKHKAVIDVAYTANTFSITYVDSTDLDYKDGKIHRYYNHWVNNLRADIQAELPPTG